MSAKPQAWAWERRVDRGERGAMLVAVLLALVLLAGLVFYVFNLGQAAQQRVVAQSAADAAAHGGAGWVARSMNQVALNNIDMSRTLAMVNILDAMPVAIEFTHIDQVALREVVESQQRRGIPDSDVRERVAELLNDVRQDVVELDALDRLLNGGSFDMRAYTWYDGPSGRGHAWRAMEALDAASRAAMDALAEAAQTSASEAGLANLRESAGGAALMLPAEAEIPFIRGHFDDFEPVLGSDDHYGGLPRRAVETARDDDWHHYRGPFDTVFGWRYFPWDYYGEAQGRVPITWLRWPDPTSRNRDYRVYGPQEWMVDWLSRNSGLVGSRFAYSTRPTSLEVVTGFTWVNMLARIKLGYIWPGGGDTVIVNRPRWENDYTRARAIGESQPGRVRTTRLLVHMTQSRYPRTSSLASGDPERTGVLSVQYPGGWQDPESWGIDKIASHVWRDEWSYQRHGVTWHVWFHYIFAGIDIGDEPVRIENPHNFTDRDALPAPIDFDYDRVPVAEATQDRYFTFLGVVRQDARGRLWSGRFDGDRERFRVALAQVRVFNNHSWDLWTPMWQAQLEPVERYDDWVATYQRDAPRLAADPALTDAPLGEIGDYLASLRPLVEAVGLEH